ncbi:XRE family transcriptional regulator [Streptomyces sp. NPDC101206]|uniref:XRE family transcriptional regulator n=1 Tax=Streptomyces sp. NPDC101206 TaxID=3366128 RepID=UPI0037F1FE3A
MDPEKTAGEDLAQLIKRLKDTYGVNESQIARAISSSPATVNAWVHRKRGTGRGPSAEKLRALAAAYPKFSEAEVFAAAGRRAPGELSPEASERIMKLIEKLTPEQQDLAEATLRAWAATNSG